MTNNELLDLIDEELKRQNAPLDAWLEGKYIVVRDYYTSDICHKFKVEKYGPIKYEIIYR